MKPQFTPEERKEFEPQLKIICSSYKQGPAFVEGLVSYPPHWKPCARLLIAALDHWHPYNFGGWARKVSPGIARVHVYTD